MIATDRSRMSDRTKRNQRTGTSARRFRIEALEARTLLTAIALDDFYSLNQGAAFQAAPSGVLGNDLIASGSPLTASLAAPPSSGSVVLNADGSFVYTPQPGFSGTDSFTYTASDGLGGLDTATVTLGVVAATATQAEITAGPRLASVDSSRGALLNATLGGLLGTGLSVDVLDWNRLAQSDIDAIAFLDALRAELGVASTSQALAADATLFQVLGAAADAAQAGGDTLLANALNGIAGQVSGLTGTVQVGDILRVDPNDGNLAEADLNALDLVTGGVQLFNFENVATTASPISISGAALGLGGLINSVTLSTQVVEPPVYVVGPAGTTFHTAATRLKLDLDLIDLNLDVSTLLGNLLGPVQALLGGLVDVTAAASVGQLSLYVEVAQGTGTLQMIDAVSSALTIQGTPGVADVYLGSIPDAVFFNRAAAITPGDVAPTAVGSLALGTSVLGVPTLNTGAGLLLRGLAQGQAPLSGTRVFDGPFPETQTFGSSAAFVTNLLNTLTSSLELTLDGPLGGVFNALTGTVLSTLSPIVSNILSPVLNTVLVGVVDPALSTMGVGIGEMDVTASPLAAAASPQANADFAQTGEGASIAVPVLSNDSDSSEGESFVVSFTQPANGTVVLNGDGTLTYTPNPNFNGIDTFVYTISDGTGEVSSATVTVQVLASNDAPTAVADSYAMAEDGVLTIAAPGLVANDTDPDGDALTPVLVAGPANGTLTLGAGGAFVYTPNANFSGTDSFTYQASDGSALSAPVVVSISVAPVNDAPVAAADAYSVAEDAPLVVAAPGLLGNDSDADADPLTAVLVAGPANGTLAFNADGSFTYTPNPNFSGSDSFTYQASDGSALSAPVVVSISVTPVNDAPVALPDAYSATQDTPLVVPAATGVLANDADPDGDALTVLVDTGPTNGTLSLNSDGSFTYTPNIGYLGPDSFTYTATDGALSSGPVTVLLNVSATPNATPVAAADAYSVAEDTPLVVAAPGLLGNDSDADADPLTAVLVAGPANGTLAFNADGSFTYTPNANFSGTDSFTYQASDGSALSAPVVVSISVTPVNDAPVALPDAYSITEDGTLTIAAPGLVGNDTDPDGDALTPVLVAGPANGTLTLGAGGAFVYTPNANFSGTDSFTYQASDGSALSAPVVVSISVAPVNDAPVAAADAYSVAEDAPLVVAAPGLLGNDTDADADPLTAVLVAGPANGTLAFNADGSFTYTPNANFSGTDSFTYQASDGSALSAPVVVSISVAPVNDAPVAAADAYSMTEDGVLTVPAGGVLANDVDPDGDALTSGLATGPANGTLTFNADGSFTYTPNANFNGVDSFTYRAWDGALFTAPILVTITVAAVDDAPIGAPDAYSVAEDAPLVVAGPGVLANDSDAEGSPLTASVASGPANGTLSLAADGSFVYTPNANFSGVDSFTYRAYDGAVFSAPIVVTIGVTPVNDAPVAAADAYSMTEDGVLTVPAGGVLANDVDPDGDALTSGLATGPANGTLTFNADGSFTYTPNANFNGVDSFTYRAWDGALFTAPILVTITVAAVNDAPTGAPDAYAVAEDSPLVVPAATGVLANDSDPEGSPLTAVLVTGPTNGTLTLNPDGSFSYTPNPDYFGPDGFVYRPSDGVTPGSPITVVISVNGVNDPPIARPDEYTTPPGGGITVPGPGVLGNDTDPDGDPIAAVLAEGPRNGTLVLNPDGSFGYTPNSGFYGPDSFSYIATGGGVQSPPVTVTINAQPGLAQAGRLERYGFHRQPTVLVLRFNAGLDAGAAQNLANYRLVGAGRDGRLGTRDDVNYALGSAMYDAATRSVTLSPTKQLPLRGNHRLVVRGGAGGLTSAGVPIDGDRDGVPGGDAVINFDQSALAGQSTTPSRPTRLAPRAVDAVLGSRNAGRLMPRGPRLRWRV